MKDSNSKLCKQIVSNEPGDFSITDVTPTLLRYTEERFGRIQGRIEGGRLGSPSVKFKTLYDIMGQPGYCGGSLEDVIHGRLGTYPWAFDHIVVYLVDGMGFRSFFKSGKKLVAEIKPEIADMLTTFPSSTPVATTSLLTGAFPAAHGVVADRFFDMDTGEMYRVKPYLSDNSKLELPRILPFTTYFVASHATPEEHSLGLITAGKSHSQVDDRRFLDFFFEDFFSIGGHYVKTTGNAESFGEARKFVKQNLAKKTWVLFIRFTIDRLAHRYGAEGPEVVSELSSVFDMIIELDHELKRLCPGTTLSMLLADHGHQDVPEGFVPFSAFKKYIDPGFRSYATNQKVLSLYYDYAHALILKGHSDPLLAYVKKQGSEFYGYDWKNESWHHLKPEGIGELATRRVRSETYGVDYVIGDLVINFDNFYVGGASADGQPSQEITSFKSTHGGLSSEEVRVPFLLWKT